MPLIDKSYFVGEILIPNTNRTDVSERLTEFIKKYETKLLRDLLGYELYKAFINGINEVSPAQKWLDLRDGVEFTNLSGKIDTWMGFTGLLGNELNIIAYYGAPGDLEYVVGRGSSGTNPDWNDPVDGDALLVDARLADATHSNTVVASRGYGRYRKDEITFNGTGFGFTDPLVRFSDGDTFFVSQFVNVVFNPGQQVFQSVIANYVYYMWMKDQHTQSVGLGEVSVKAENADKANPTVKIVRAWNEMIEWIKGLKDYLDANKETFTEWEEQNQYALYRNYRPTNVFGI